MRRTSAGQCARALERRLLSTAERCALSFCCSCRSCWFAPRTRGLVKPHSSFPIGMAHRRILSLGESPRRHRASRRGDPLHLLVSGLEDPCGLSSTRWTGRTNGLSEAHQCRSFAAVAEDLSKQNDPALSPIRNRELYFDCGGHTDLPERAHVLIREDLAIACDDGDIVSPRRCGDEAIGGITVE